MLSPIVTRGTEAVVTRFAARPPDESLDEAFGAAFREMRPPERQAYSCYHRSGGLGRRANAGRAAVLASVEASLAHFEA